MVPEGDSKTQNLGSRPLDYKGPRHKKATRHGRDNAGVISGHSAPYFWGKQRPVLPRQKRGAEASKTKQARQDKGGKTREARQGRRKQQGEPGPPSPLWEP
jgi:hypothetical protein